MSMGEGERFVPRDHASSPARGERLCNAALCTGTCLRFRGETGGAKVVQTARYGEAAHGPSPDRRSGC